MAMADNPEKDSDGIRNSWTKEEDDLLKHLVNIHGTKSWPIIAKCMATRTRKSCRLRWFNHLSPYVNRHAFSPEEDEIIIREQARLGNKWATIARNLPGRTDNAVKNRWYLIMRRKLKSLKRSPPVLAIPLQAVPLIKSQEANPNVIKGNPESGAGIESSGSNPPGQFSEEFMSFVQEMIKEEVKKYMEGGKFEAGMSKAD